jgi:hypothetical protein
MDSRQPRLKIGRFSSSSGRKRRSSAEIKRLVTEFQSSGLRQNEFCRNHGLSLSSLQRQLKKRGREQGEVKEGGGLVAVELGREGARWQGSVEPVEFGIGSRALRRTEDRGTAGFRFENLGKPNSHQAFGPLAYNLQNLEIVPAVNRTDAIFWPSAGSGAHPGASGAARSYHFYGANQFRAER